MRAVQSDGTTCIAPTRPQHREKCHTHAASPLRRTNAVAPDSARPERQLEGRTAVGDAAWTSANVFRRDCAWLRPTLPVDRRATRTRAQRAQVAAVRALAVASMRNPPAPMMRRRPDPSSRVDRRALRPGGPDRMRRAEVGEQGPAVVGEKMFAGLTSDGQAIPVYGASPTLRLPSHRRLVDGNGPGSRTVLERRWRRAA